ncbi:biotin/lipoate A/B protein ligase family protein [Herbiconiux moechotypicola]|uniref:Biotin/lipoate A/B protein ligase family protein n=1 Tax=Herbiconiux moechotypicola TaxID=637393 RepID=A0ABN3E806_9MICO
MEVTGSTGGGAKSDLAGARRLLALAESLPPDVLLVRSYVPEPTAAFSAKEAAHPAFAEAVGLARAMGFEPVLRPAGGTVALYGAESIVFDAVWAQPLPHGSSLGTYRHGGRLITDVLGEWGIDARVGSVPGEYCPGEHSVNARGEVKLVGVAQRVTSRARLYSAVVAVESSAYLAVSLADLYRLLGYPFDELSSGSLRNEGAVASGPSVGRALVTAFGAGESTMSLRAAERGELLAAWSA